MMDVFKHDNAEYAVDTHDDDGEFLELQSVTLTREELANIAGEAFVEHLEKRARERWIEEQPDRAAYWAEHTS